MDIVKKIEKNNINGVKKMKEKYKSGINGLKRKIKRRYKYFKVVKEEKKEKDIVGRKIVNK